MIGRQHGNAGGWGPPGGSPPPGYPPGPSVPGGLRPASTVLMVTMAAVVGLTALLVLSGMGAAFLGGDYGWRIVLIILLGTPGLGISFWFAHWAGNGIGMATGVAVLGLCVLVAGTMATEHVVLSVRGEEVVAVVTQKSGPDWGPRRHSQARCTLQARDGTEVRPQLGGSRCFRLEAGQTVRVMADPDGRVGPLLMEQYEGAGYVGLAVLFAITFAGLLVVAAVRGRRRQRSEAARTPGPPSPRSVVG